ncbi:MAG: GHMP kinase [Streptosporangiaceae bacterium]
MGARNLRPADGDDGYREPQFGVGIGYAPAHHGELLQGMFDDGAGQLRRALVTLPQPGRGSRAVFRPSGNHWGVVGTPDLVKVRRAAVLALREFATHPAPVKGGQIEIIRDFPLGVGMGSSTSDVTATIRAVADFHGVMLSREEVGRLAVLAEVASDSIMIDDRVVLFAHRDGRVLETFGHRLPPVIVVGCDTEPGSAVDTLGLQQPDYSDWELGAFQVLRGAMRRAIATEDVALLGRLATASARINQRFLPKPALETLLELCLRLGGSGIQVAHSGTVAGLIFDSRLPRIEAAVEGCIAGIDDVGLAVTAVISPQPAVGRDASGRAISAKAMASA